MAAGELLALIWFTVLNSIMITSLPTASSWLIRSTSVPAPMPTATSEPSHSSIKGAYWPSKIAQTFPPSMIPTIYFNHLFYAFVDLNNSTYELNITQLDDQWMKNFTATLHAKSPPAKAFLSIGGADSSPSTFSIMSSNATYRNSFIRSTIYVARKYGFDGMDLDWEYPEKQDMANLGLLFQEWYNSLLFESIVTGKSRILITSTVYFSSEFFLDDNRVYPIDAMNQYVDIVNLMCYDYHGNWDTSVTGSPALLFDNSSNISTSYGISSWINAGVASEKLVMGLPLYGRTWLLKDPNVHGIGAPAVAIGPGPNGVMTYNEILDFNLNNFAITEFDNVTVSTYSYAGNVWIGYDGEQSTKEKVKFAKDHGLGGYFLWSMGDDKDWILSSTASSTWNSNI